MLLEEDPATLLRHTISNFSTQPDRAAVSRINDSLSTLQTSRSLRIEDAETALRKLSRQLATASSQHREATDSHNAHQHSSEVVELDTKKFKVAKQAQELEVEGEKLESELARLRRRLDELEEQGVEGDVQARRQREADDPTILRLWLYRSLGVTLEQDHAGNYNKATVNNAKKGDVHVLNIEPSKFSKHFYADYLWNTMQG